MSYNYQDAPRESQQEYFGKVHTDNKETLQNALKRIEELKKENERLRTRCEQARDEGTGYMQQLEEENAEAKEIIRHLLLLPYANNEEVFADVGMFLTKAEQFLKE